jgi:hypothetical protein
MLGTSALYSRAAAFYCALPLIAVLVLPALARSVPVFSYVGKCSLQQYQVPDSKTLESCQKCDIDDNGTLTCACLDSAGQSQTSSLAIYECPKSYSYPKCAGEIEVADGKLYCRKISAESTYDESAHGGGCFSCIKEGPILKCDCVKEGRAHVPTQLDLSNCDAPISNCRGKLTCGLCKEPKANSWIWFQACAVGASAVSVAVIVAKTCIWKKVFRRT